MLKSKPGSGSESMEATARSSQSDAEASDGGSIAEMVGYHCDGPHDAAGPYFKISIRFL